MDSSKDNFYYVEKILKKQTFPSLRYLVKWEGYEISQATWEPVENLENVRDMIEEFEEEQERRKELQNKRKKPNMMINTSAESSIEKKNFFNEEMNENLLNEENEKKNNECKIYNKKDNFKSFPKSKENYRKYLKESEIPTKVLTVKLIEDELYCLIKFSERSDGLIPEDCYVLSQELADKFPKILIDFYESKIKFT